MQETYLVLFSLLILDLHVHCINPVSGIDKIPLKQDAGADQTMVFRTYDPEKVRTPNSYLQINSNVLRGSNLIQGPAIFTCIYMYMMSLCAVEGCHLR